MNDHRVDVGAVRAGHPIADEIAAAGIELRRAGHGWMGCCPFHDDTTASLSVDGVPDRFHCFGCGAAGDVIDFVQRVHGLTFSQAVEHLDGRMPQPAVRPALPRAPARPAGPPSERAYEVNALAWAHYSRRVGHGAAISHLRRRRGIDVAALEDQFACPVVGHAGTGWTTLTDHLHDAGVTDDELVALDLAQATRRGTLIDTLRDRLVVPVTTADGRIGGLIGRDTSGDPRAPKYRNPTRTVTYDKATTLYQPTPAGHPYATVVILEGPLDALAIAATAAAAGRLDEFTPVAAGGVAATAAQARRITTLTHGRVVIAMDGDAPGRQGTQRWVEALLHADAGPILVAELPDRLDPADWLTQHGPDGLRLVDPTHTGTVQAPRQPGPELVRAVLSRSRREPVRDVTAALLPLLQSLPPDPGRDLAAGAVAEMTRQGWNPDGAFTRALAAACVPTPTTPAYATNHPSLAPAGPTLT